MKVKVFSEIEVDADDQFFAGAMVKQALRSSFLGSEPKVWTDTDRDPRLTPKPGDKLVKRDLHREVTEVGSQVVTYRAWRELGNRLFKPTDSTLTCRISTWINWARESEVE